jgi:hypothetical protein
MDYRREAVFPSNGRDGSEPNWAEVAQRCDRMPRLNAMDRQGRCRLAGLSRPVGAGACWRPGVPAVDLRRLRKADWQGAESVWVEGREEALKGLPGEVAKIAE